MHWGSRNVILCRWQCFLISSSNIMDICERSILQDLVCGAPTDSIPSLQYYFKLVWPVVVMNNRKNVFQKERLGRFSACVSTLNPSPLCGRETAGNMALFFSSLSSLITRKWRWHYRKVLYHRPSEPVNKRTFSKNLRHYIFITFFYSKAKSKNFFLLIFIFSLGWFNIISKIFLADIPV